MRNSPQYLRFPVLENIKGTPIANNGIEYALNFTLNPRMAMIQPVTVVPILAPIITPADSTSERIPALTNETVITVVAEDDWTKAVIRNPVKTPKYLFLVIFLRMLRICEPAALWIPSLIIFIPKMKKARAPAILITVQNPKVDSPLPANARLGASMTKVSTSRINFFIKIRFAFSIMV